MADKTQTEAVRSAIMRAVKSKNTAPEILVRSALHKHGYRFRLHKPGLAGKPDIVLPKFKIAIRVMGCFWHGHKCPRGDRMPKTNTAYWINKIHRNVARDKVQKKSLKEDGWRVIDVWECQLKRKNWIDPLIKKIKNASKQL